MRATREAVLRSADIAVEKQERKKALDFPKLFNAPNGMLHLGLSGGAGGWVGPSMGMLLLLKKAGFPLLFIHSGANTLNL